ncbi:hypothetical protein LINPERHAP2_LOCUS4957, partial [Linum perenne]
AKKSAEDEVKSVREEISELRKEQTKIFALFQKTNPDINVDDLVSSPLQDDIDLNHNFNEGGSNQVQQDYNLGVGPLMPMLQSSTETIETETNN